MKVDDLKNATHLLEKLDRLESLGREVLQRDIDFVEVDRVRPIGRMQLDPSKVDDLKAHLASAALAWFVQERHCILAEIKVCGVDVTEELAKPKAFGAHRFYPVGEEEAAA